jgi:hypothetical protein
MHTLARTLRPYLLRFVEPRLTAVSEEAARMWAMDADAGRVQRTPSVDEVESWLSEPDIRDRLRSFAECGS